MALSLFPSIMHTLYSEQVCTRWKNIIFFASLFFFNVMGCTSPLFYSKRASNIFGSNLWKFWGRVLLRDLLQAKFTLDEIVINVQKIWMKYYGSVTQIETFIKRRRFQVIYQKFNLTILPVNVWQCFINFRFC